MLKNDNVTKNEEKKQKSITMQMVERENYRTVSLSSADDIQECLDSEVEEEKDVFGKLQQIYLSSNKEVSEILESEDVKSELYASALYIKLKSAGLGDEIIRKEIDNILRYSLTFTEMDEMTWLDLFGNLIGTISEYDNVMDYYYPLAAFIHKNECTLEHSTHEFDENRLVCSVLEDMSKAAFVEVDSTNYIVEMIKASEDIKVLNQYNRIINAGIDFNDALVELNSIYELSQIPMCIDEDVWNELFKNLLTTVGKYDNVFEVYGDLARYIHELSCDFKHYTDEYGVNVCEGMKLEYTYED